MTTDSSSRDTVSAGDTGEFLAIGSQTQASGLDPDDTGEFLIVPGGPSEPAPAEMLATEAVEGVPQAKPEGPADALEDDASAAIAALSTDEGAHSVEDPEIPEPAPQVPSDEAAPSSEEGEPSEAEAGPALDAYVAEDASPSETVPFATVSETPKPPKPAPDRISGTAKGIGTLAWGSRSDVGCVRDHNEDSFVVRFPLFAVADGMGGHEAGEIASSIAVSALASETPEVADDASLAAAVEAANLAVIQGATNGLGRPGMGTTTTAVFISGRTMSVAHVGDSRCYLLHKGKLVRVTHDHSLVEELVAAGEITAEEARIHPNRSIITRALGNDPNMSADHFCVDVAQGDRVLLCSDGLSSMIPDDLIEEILVSSTAPQPCADALVEAALAAGGHDNVTCLVIDVKNDGNTDRQLKRRLRNLATLFVGLVLVACALFAGIKFLALNTWYLSDSNGYVALCRGIKGMPSVLMLDETVEVSGVQTAQLSDAVGKRLSAGITFRSEEEARAVLEDYKSQVDRAAGGGSARSK